MLLRTRRVSKVLLHTRVTESREQALGNQVLVEVGHNVLPRPSPNFPRVGLIIYDLPHECTKACNVDIRPSMRDCWVRKNEFVNSKKVSVRMHVTP